jgi:hypothetical protein
VNHPLDTYTLTITVMMCTARVHAVDNVHGIKQGERMNLVYIINEVGAKKVRRATHVLADTSDTLNQHK